MNNRFILKSKHSIVIFFTVAVIMFLFGFNAITANAEESTVMSNWTLSSDGVLTIEGDGEMEDLSFGSDYWRAYASEIKKIIIGEGVTSIGNYAFAFFLNLEEVNMPDTIVRIGDYAFSNCYKLKTISVPENAEYIGKYAFSACAIEEIVISQNIKFIGEDAIGQSVHIIYNGLACDFLRIYQANAYWGWNFEASGNGHKFDNGVIVQAPSQGLGGMIKYTCELCNNSYYLEYYVEDDICAITNLLCEEGNQTLRDFLYTVNFPDEIDEYNVISVAASGTSFPIGYYPITKYKEVCLPESVISIPRSAFTYTNLEKINIPSGITQIGYNAFANSNIMEFEFPAGVTTVEESAFNWCNKLKRVKLNDGIVSIENNAFAGTIIDAIELPNTLKSIGVQAFYGCANLHSVVIPESVTYIGEVALGMYYSNVYNEYRAYSDFVIYGKKGSEAERYANANGIKFVELTNDYYSISYNLDGGNNNPNNITRISASDSDFILLDPSKEGYKFEGWYSDDRFVNKVEKVNSAANTNIILYAKWRLIYKPYGYQVVIDSNFDLRYIVELSDEVKNDNTSYIEFTVGEAKSNIKYTAIADSFATYVLEVPAKNIGDTITAQLYYAGEYYELPEFSIKAYLEKVIENRNSKPEYAYAKELAKAILTYGAYCQLYFGYNTDNLANNRLAEDAVADISDQEIIDSISFIEKSTSNSDFVYAGASLVCNSDTYMRVYLTNKNHLTLEQINAKYKIYVSGGSNPIYDIEVTNGVVCIVLKNIPAAELDNAYFFTIEGDDTEMTIKHSPYVYVKESMSSDDVKLKNLTKALYMYCVAANDYFNKYSLPN